MTSSATRFVDLTAAELVEHAIRRGEGTLAANGAFVAKTGRRTGRSLTTVLSLKNQAQKMTSNGAMSIAHSMPINLMLYGLALKLTCLKMTTSSLTLKLAPILSTICQ